MSHEALRRIQRKIVDFSLRPSIREKVKYNTTLNRFISFFSDKESIDELKKMGVVHDLADHQGYSYTCEVVNTEDGYEYRIKRSSSTDSATEDGGLNSSQIAVRYSSSYELQVLTYTSENGHSYTTERISQDEAQKWKTTPITTDQIAGIKSAKQEMSTITNEMNEFLVGYYMSFIPKLDNIPEDVSEQLKVLENYKREREKSMKKRLHFGMSRRDFLKISGVSLLGLYLSACLPFANESGNSNDLAGLSPTIAEASSEVNPEMFEEPIYQEMLRAQDDRLSDPAQDFLKAFLVSRVGKEIIASGWEKVATPSFLYEQGVFAGSDISHVYRFKQRNGGNLFFEPRSQTYIKVAPVDMMPDAMYLEQSANYYRKGWAAAGVPDEIISRVQVSKDFMYEGRPSILLATPNMGTTLETYTAFLKNSNATGANAILTEMLEKYYIETLVPMNAAGVFQSDPNFRNICMFTQADGTVKLVPIDLAQKPVSFEKAQIFREQYEILARRAAGGKRGISMLPYEQFLAKYPQVARQMGMIAEMGETVRINVSLPGTAQKVLLIIPQNMLGGANQSERVMTNIVHAVEKQYGAQYKILPQGSLIPIEVQTESGMSRVLIMKSNAVGDTVKTFGGKWGELLKIGKSGLQIASDVLFLAWIASEISEITDPDYVAILDSDIAFPDSVNSLDNIGSIFNLMYDRLQRAKKTMINRSIDYPVPWSTVAEQMFGLTKKDVLMLISQKYMTQEEIRTQMLQIARKAAFPPARSEVKFQSPFPIFLEGAEYPTSAMFSAFDGDDGEKVVILWAQTAGYNGEPITIPVSSFTKQMFESEWRMEPIVNKPWSIEFTLNQDLKLKLQCTKAVSDGRRFELQCVMQK